MSVTLGRLFPALLLFGERFHGATSELKQRADSRPDDNFVRLKSLCPSRVGVTGATLEILRQMRLRKSAEDTGRYKPELKPAAAYAALISLARTWRYSARFR
jgi:hypothetical protein